MHSWTRDSLSGNSLHRPSDKAMCYIPCYTHYCSLCRDTLLEGTKAPGAPGLRCLSRTFSLSSHSDTGSGSTERRSLPCTTRRCGRVWKSILHYCDADTGDHQILSSRCIEHLWRLWCSYLRCSRAAPGKTCSFHSWPRNNPKDQHNLLDDLSQLN